MTDNSFPSQLLALLILCHSMGLSSCAVTPAPYETFTKNLTRYYEAKSSFAVAIQTQLAANSDVNEYRLVAINGPTYAIGTLISKSNRLDVESRSCVVEESQLPPVEPWSAFPVMKSSSTLSLDAEIPLMFKKALADTERFVGMGYTQGRVANLEMTDVGQQLLSRSETRRILVSGPCADSLKSLEDGAIIVRGIVSGVEMLTGTAEANLDTNLARLVGPGRRFQFHFSRTGDFSIEDKEPTPKFAVYTAVRAEKTMGSVNDPVVISLGAPSAKELASVGLLPEYESAAE